jgi:hypothetical protein
MKLINVNFLTCSIVAFISLLTFGCKNEKVERKLIGEWEVINSILTTRDSAKLIHQADNLGTISFNKNKIDKTLIDLNLGSWNFNNFPDTIVLQNGNLSWTSTDKGDYMKIPWTLDIFFSTDYVKDFPVKGSTYFNCYQGKFDVTEVKNKSHYKIIG